MEAFAFDGTDQVEQITGGTVRSLNLAHRQELWRSFDWALCLEVAKHSNTHSRSVRSDGNASSFVERGVW